MNEKLKTLVEKVKSTWNKTVHSKDESYKGSSYQGKGSINTDASTFNKPRR